MVYIENAMTAVVATVVDGIHKLNTTSQISVVSIVVTALCDAWMCNILNKQIKFRLVIFGQKNYITQERWQIRQSFK